MNARKMLVAVLLACGIGSSLVYIAADVLAAMRWEGYEIAHRMVSELIAVGSPTRAFIFGPMLVYNVLIVAFGVGVWMAARKRSTKVSGAMLLAYGVASSLGLLVFPLRPESGNDVSGAMGLSGVLHSAITVVTVLLIFAFIGFGSGAAGRGFRLYSIATILVVLAGGILAGTQVQAAAAGLPTPWVGVTERANIYSTMLWIAMLAIVLLRANRESEAAWHATSADPRPGGVKKVVALVGSGHRGGATHRAAATFLENLEAFGDVEGEIVTLSDYDIRTCRGCKACFSYGKERCPLKDDRDVVFQKMLDADGVVFASPNYSWQVSGYMKVFLDRIGFVFHRPRFHGKTATAIVVQGIALGGRVRKYLEFCCGGLGFKVVKGSVIRTLEPMTEQALQQMDDTLAEQSRRFHDELLRPAFPAPSLLQLAVFRMGRTGIRLNAPSELHDWAYYRDHGWFESDYFYPVRLGPLKKAVGALFDWITAKTGMFSVAPEAGPEAPIAPRA